MGSRIDARRVISRRETTAEVSRECGSASSVAGSEAGKNRGGVRADIEEALVHAEPLPKSLDRLDRPKRWQACGGAAGFLGKERR
jgi:hypothetical protein